jgi:hypothetical protein
VTWRRPNYAACLLSPDVVCTYSAGIVARAGPAAHASAAGRATRARHAGLLSPRSARAAGCVGSRPLAVARPTCAGAAGHARGAGPAARARRPSRSRRVTPTGYQSPPALPVAPRSCPPHLR